MDYESFRSRICKLVAVFALHGLHVVLGRSFDKAGYDGAQLLQLLAAEVLHLRGEHEGSGGQHGLAGVDVEAVLHEAGLEDVAAEGEDIHLDPTHATVAAEESVGE